MAAFFARYSSSIASSGFREIVSLIDNNAGFAVDICPSFYGELSSMKLRRGNDWIELIYRANDFSDPAPGDWRGKASHLFPGT